MNRKDEKQKETLLHKAAKTASTSTIRKLLYDINCEYETDPNILNRHGKTAAFMYFINLLTKANDFGSDNCLTADEISCFIELLWFTYDPESLLENQVNEIFDMIDYCYQFSDVPIRKLYMEIINVFMSPQNPRHYFVEKILKANLPSDYCLVGVLFAVNERLHESNFVNLRSNFLRELFTLFMANESFFEEYIAEAMSTGWRFNVQNQSSAFCSLLAKESRSDRSLTTIPSLFRFMKFLIQYEVDFVQMLKLTRLHLPPTLADNLLVSVFVPLSNFINATIDLTWTLRLSKQKKFSYFNFNETELVPNDLNALAERKSQFEVVSLKNLSRMAVRKHCFENYSHYKALSILYSLHIPIKLRNFLCYNNCNLKF